ncbi:MAG: type II toxin-antitoxin system VapC family toxin [candidate division KSB1 bacterium]|nr:type II toxin-antitoxin system VapC family toxin [candidate division KSB1 bacterium]
MLFDTCALLWATLNPDALTENEREIAFAALENGSAAVSSISFWEIGINIKRKKLDIRMSLHTYIDKIHQFNGFEIIPVDERSWAKNIALDWPHKDPADRTIVATAMLRDLPILTRDTVIREFYAKLGWG